MMKMINHGLGHHVQTFFGDHLTVQRDLSPHTVLSYRDTFKLFLSFASRHHRKQVADLGFEEVGPKTVLDFLEHLEKQRGSSIRTRNVRLAALHTFFRYVAAREPQVLDLCQRISVIPIKKAPIPKVEYIEHDEVLHILKTIDRSTVLGRRDYVIVHLLFETGLRAQEIANLRTKSLRLFKPFQLHVLGKGRRERVCPLRANTATLLRVHIRENGLSMERDEPLLLGIRGKQLTRYGLLRLVHRHVRLAAKSRPSLLSKRIGVHTFRHATAIHLLRSGIPLPIVQKLLGHVNLMTTDHYTEIDNEMKRKALESSDPVPIPRRKSSWKKDHDLLAWLEAL